MSGRPPPEFLLDALNDLLDDLAAGGGSTLLIDGSAGAGKSTALADLMARATTRGVRVQAAEAERVTPVRAQLATPGGPDSAGSTPRGRLLLVDDAHRADAASLRWVMDELAGPAGPTVCVLTVRHGDAVTAPDELDQFRRSLRSRTVGLRPIGPAAVAAHLERAFGEPVDPQFAKACYRATRGVPLLVEELTNFLHASGCRPDASGVPLVATAASDAVAHSVARVLQRRHPLAVPAAQALAVLDAPCSDRDLAQLCEVSEQVARDVRDALREVLVASGRDGGLTHPFVRQSLYQQIPRPERERWHDAAARLLRDRADLETLTWHIDHGSRHLDPRAAAVSEAIAHRAMSAGRSDLAERCLRAAIEQVVSPRRRVDLERLLTRLRWNRADLPADDLLEHAVTRRASADPALTATALYVQARTGGASALVAASVSLSGHQPTLDPQVEAQRGSIEALIAGPHRDQQASIVLARAGRDRAGAVAAARAEAQHASEPPGPAPRTTGVILTLLAADELDEVDPLLAALATRPDDDAELHCLRARRLLRAGRVGEASASARRAHAALSAGAAPPLGHSWAIVMVEAAGSAGEELPSDLTSPSLVAADQVSRLEHALAGAVAGAPAGVARAVERTLRVGSEATTLGIENPEALPWRAHALRLLADSGSDPRAETLARENLTAARAWGTPSAIGHALLLTAATAPASPDREAVLREAVEALDASPAELLRAQARRALGVHLLQSGQRDRARPLLADALDEASRLGARTIADATFAALQEAGGRPRRRRRTGVAGLTARELEVARRAADGYTNREIADELFLIQRTVELHLTKAFRKLGISRRSELAAHLEHDH